MKKGFRLVIMVTLSVVLLAGISLVGCGDDEEEALVQPDIELYQYLKGTTVDMDDATLNSMAEGGGEGGAYSMGMGFSPGLAGELPGCKEYANLGPQSEAAAAAAYDLAYNAAYDAAIADEKTEAEAVAAGEAAGEAAEAKTQQDIVSEWVVNFLGQVEAGIADADVPLTENIAYTTLHELTGMGWIGKWSQGLWTPSDAFWATWPDPAGRGGYCEFKDHVAANGLADTDLTTYDFDGFGEGSKYAELTADQRDDVDAAFQKFVNTMTVGHEDNQCDPADVTALYTAEIMKPEHAEALAAGMAAMADPPEGMTGEDAFVWAIAHGYPEDYTVCVNASLAAGKASDAFGILMELNKPAADGWAAAIEAEVHPRQAFFRWIARGAVAAMGAAGVLVELSVGEFSFKISNPNEYFISIDNMSINISVNSDGFGLMPAIDVDAAKLAVGDKIWIPPAVEDVDGEVIVKLSAPIKWYDMVTWLVMAGYDATAAGTYASDVWGKIHPFDGSPGTAVFDVTVESTISSETETITASYTAQWVPTAS